MRKLSVIILLIVTACSSTKLNDRWRDPDYGSFKPKNILVIGVTPDSEIRKTFESLVKNELNTRGINALQSTFVFDKSFQDSEKTEKEIEAQVALLISKGYDTVLVSLVKGIDKNVSYSSESSKTDYHLRHFVLYYLAYQNAYFSQEDYKQYKVYNVETSVYSLKKNTVKTLIWTGSFDLVDPNNNTKAITSFVKKLVKVLQTDKIIPRKAKV